MALVESRRNAEQLHGSIEMIEDSSQVAAAPEDRYLQQRKDAKNPGGPGPTKGTSTQKKDDMILVTVQPLTASADDHKQSSLESPTSKVDDESLDPAAPIEDEQTPTTNREASRRYSEMMASLAAARVEESRANLLKNSKASPGNSTGVSVGSALGSWEWQTRQDREDDYSMQEKYFAEEL